LPSVSTERNIASKGIPHHGDDKRKARWTGTGCTQRTTQNASEYITLPISYVSWKECKSLSRFINQQSYITLHRKHGKKKTCPEDGKSSMRESGIIKWPWGLKNNLCSLRSRRCASLSRDPCAPAQDRLGPCTPSATFPVRTFSPGPKFSACL
jgi:hypothetical protein